MPAIVTMPSLSPTMKSGNLVKWCKSIGDNVDVGDVIAEIDTDKATMEVEALQKGVLAKILIEERTHDVAVKTPLAILRQSGDSDEDIERAVNDVLQNTATDNSSNDAKQQIDTKEHSNNRQVNDKKDNRDKHIFASPLAKRLANEYGVDLSNIQGTGPYGRIVKDDVLQSRENVSTSASYMDKPISNMRRVIAERLTTCKQTVPHFSITKKINVSRLVSILSQIKNSNTEIKITPNEFVIKAVALALVEHPEINVSWQNDCIRHFNTVDVSVAVAVQDGLLTPVIRLANTKSIGDIAKEVRILADKAKNGKLTSAECAGGAITTSNLGMLPINNFQAIINPPQASIIAISSIIEEPVILNNQITVGHTLTLTMSVDHRVIDGRPAATFLCRVAELLESAMQLLVL